MRSQMLLSNELNNAIQSPFTRAPLKHAFEMEQMIMKNLLFVDTWLPREIQVIIHQHVSIMTREAIINLILFLYGNKDNLKLLSF